VPQRHIITQAGGQAQLELAESRPAGIQRRTVAIATAEVLEDIPCRFHRVKEQDQTLHVKGIHRTIPVDVAIGRGVGDSSQRQTCEQTET